MKLTLSRLGVIGLTSVASLLVSLVTIVLSFSLATFSIFEMLGKQYLAETNLSLVNFVYSSGVIDVVGAFAGIFAITFLFYITRRSRSHSRVSYTLEESEDAVQVTVPSANQVFTINLNNPRSVSVTIKEINRVISSSKVI